MLSIDKLIVGSLTPISKNVLALYRFGNSIHRLNYQIRLCTGKKGRPNDTFVSYIPRSFDIPLEIWVLAKGFLRARLEP